MEDENVISQTAQIRFLLKRGFCFCFFFFVYVWTFFWYNSGKKSCFEFVSSFNGKIGYICHSIHFTGEIPEKAEWCCSNLQHGYRWEIGKMRGYRRTRGKIIPQLLILIIHILWNISNIWFFFLIIIFLHRLLKIYILNSVKL